MPAEKASVSVETFAASLPSRYLDCRELGHHWRAWSARWDNEARAYDRTLRCTRCKSERTQLLNDMGHVIANRYRYADGYQAKNVESVVRISRDVFRLESLTRLLTKQ